MFKKGENPFAKGGKEDTAGTEEGSSRHSKRKKMVRKKRGRA